MNKKNASPKPSGSDQKRETKAGKRRSSVLYEIDVGAEEIFRLVMMRGVLLPAASFLPRRWALALAGGVAWSLLPWARSARRDYRNVRSAFGQGWIASIRLTQRRQARPLRELVFFRRISKGREHPVTDLNIVDENIGGLRRLQQAGEPCIIVIGHFSRVAVLASMLPKYQYLPPKLTSAVTTRRNIAERRADLNFRTLLDGGAVACGPGLDYLWVSPEHRPSLAIYRHLIKKDAIIYISLDAPWAWRNAEEGTYERPFAGHSRRKFSTGTVRLAQATGVAIVPCVCYSTADERSVTLSWGDPIHPSGEITETMDILLDALETAIGERPDQYLLPIGLDRRWNQESQRWEDGVP